MFHDLNVNVPQFGRKAVLETLHRLGYDVVAFSRTIQGQKKLLEKDLPTRETYSELKDARNTILHPDLKKRRRGITVLERVTIIIDDVSNLAILSSSDLDKFDLVAVQPTSEKLLQACLQFDIDIICLPIEQRQTYLFKRAHMNVAVEKGVMFEFLYSMALQDVSRRRSLVSSLNHVVGVTNGRYMLFSSGATSNMELRAPLDVINLGIVFGIPQQFSRDLVIKNGQAAVTHGDIRARTHKGIIRVTVNDHKNGKDGGASSDKDSVKV